MNSAHAGKVLVFDTKPYDREYLLREAGEQGPGLVFADFRLEPPTASSAAGYAAACAFVNDDLGREVLGTLSEAGVRMVALRCAGFNNVDREAAREFGISITRVPAYSPHAVAEHTVALLLTLNRKIHRAFVRVRELNFSLAGLVGFDLHGKTLGLVGTGKTGRIVGSILSGFGMQILAHDPFPDLAWAESCGARYVSLEELAPQSDVISLHLPLTPETHHVVNAEFLAKVKRGAVLLNVSRGRLIDTTSLIDALKTGQLGGVALDVYEEEEGIFFEDLSGQLLEDDELARLLTFPNVLITAHQAFLTHEALAEISRVTIENLRRFLAGQPFLDGTAVVGG